MCACDFLFLHDDAHFVVFFLVCSLLERVRFAINAVFSSFRIVRVIPLKFRWSLNWWYSVDLEIGAVGSSNEQRTINNWNTDSEPPAAFVQNVHNISHGENESVSSQSLNPIHKYRCACIRHNRKQQQQQRNSTPSNESQFL